MTIREVKDNIGESVNKIVRNFRDFPALFVLLLLVVLHMGLNFVAHRYRTEHIVSFVNAQKTQSWDYMRLQQKQLETCYNRGR